MYIMAYIIYKLKHIIDMQYLNEISGKVLLQI